MQAQTIEEVITRMESILDECIRTNNRAGYFAALYHKVTCRVRDGIKNNEFEDGARMERLDVLFANRYIAAWDQWKQNQQPTDSWLVAFKATKKFSVLVLQQLLLGMNAHINLDLGIAAVETAKAQGHSLESIHKDFNSINTILAALTYEVMSDINRVSPLLSLMGFHATNYNSILIQFTISNARDGAWCFAEDLNAKQGQVYNDCIKTRDTTIKNLGQGLVSPSGLLRFTVWFICLFEWHKPSKIINVLYKSQKKHLSFSKK